ncbi:MAG TPA: DUF4124 domain-containing protein [Gammaproteobacteria bacterium]|nr:DUF4124 domain-containing protein [Gammaproteobacteria bacterium]
MQTFSFLKPSIMLYATACLLSRPAVADTVYRYTDEQGRTVYSSQAPAGDTPADRLKLPAEPSTARKEEARERQHKMLQSARQMEQARIKRNREIAEQNRIKREQQMHYPSYKEPENNEEQGPYYGIPGRGILVLPARPGIRSGR